MTHHPDHEENPVDHYDTCWICHKAVDTMLEQIAPDIMTIGPAEVVRRLKQAFAEVIP